MAAGWVIFYLTVELNLKPAKRGRFFLAGKVNILLLQGAANE
jgi:hypothetical protein